MEGGVLNYIVAICSEVKKMKIPMAKKAAAILLRLYDDSARVVRRSFGNAGNIVDEVIYSAQRCHLSAQKGLGSKSASSFKQTEAEARALKSYQLYFPPDCDIRAGDLITVTHCGIIRTGRAGEPAFGKLTVRVALDSYEPL